MGIKRTEATKDAAEIVLADDNLASIERTVEEGRRTFDGIQKSIVFLLPTNGAQSLVLLIAVLFALPVALEPVQILWVNLIAAVSLSLALAFELAEPDVMHTLFGSSRLLASAWAITMAISAVIFLIVEGGKALLHRTTR